MKNKMTESRNIASKKPFRYRSISFGTPPREKVVRGNPTGKVFTGIKLNLDPRFLELAAKLGFNDITIQTENVMKGKMEALRKWADNTETFKLAKELGMTISVWVHELQDHDKNLGELTLDNERFWKVISDRYRKILNEVLPDIDFLVLTTVESEISVTKDGEVLTKLVNLINEECRAAGKKLIFRTFIWYPEEAKAIHKALSDMNNDIIVQSKCVPQDWHLRGLHNPFIGEAGERQQYVEFDIAGEYNKVDYVACCFTDVIKKRLEYAAARGCTGVSVRVNRYDRIVWGQAQEANLWFIGYWASGKSFDEDEIWKAYATTTFGRKAAPSMIKALRPTGGVIAEAICVEREPFGYSRDYLPAWRGIEKYHIAPQGHCPFDCLHSPHKWDESLRRTYEEIKMGDPEIIRRKTKKFAKGLISANKSLEIIESVKNNLSDEAYAFFRWKIQENRFCFVMLCNMELAWLKAIRRAYSNSGQEKDTLLKEIKVHVDNIEKIYAEEGDKSIILRWWGKKHNLRRGEYHDWMEWVKRFRRYAGIQEN